MDGRDAPLGRVPTWWSRRPGIGWAFLASLLTWAACGSEPDQGAAARLVDGVQVAEIEAGPLGYSPQRVTLQPGIPARLVFTRTVDAACSAQIQIPAFGVPVTDLPLHEPVAIEFTPTEAGDFTFICGMDMQRGALLVEVP
ncbi:MAG: cupredoxin domain-containing protein [Bacteroidota bacterium]